MAMIQCPECGKQISSAAASCPNCGHPLTPTKSEVGTGVSRGFGGCAGVLLFLFVSLFALIALGAIIRECQG